VTLDSGTAALLGALIGGAAVVIAQYLTARHDRDQAKTAREQERKERTYEDVMTTVNRAAMTIARTAPLMTWEGAPGPPEPMTDDELNALNARIGLYGSDAVRDSLVEFSAAQQRFTAAVWMHQDMKKTATTGLVEAHLKVDEERQHLYDLKGKIEALARAELHR
jgi:hypothetical protein